MSQVIKNFSIDQIVNIEGYKVRIHNYCGTTLIRTLNGVADMQLYEVTLKNGELAYASDAGLMKNDYSIFDKIIAGIGYRGNINYSMFKIEYTMWKDMIYRCHSVNNRLYPFYGGAGITIVPRWYCFELFVYDIVNLPNYDNIYSGLYVIDISSKQKNIPWGQRVYDPNRVSIKKYYSSDVYENTERAKELGSNQEVGRFLDNYASPTSPQYVQYQPLPDGRWPEEAYLQTIQNPPQLPIPDNDDLGYNIIRTFNGVYYKNRPPLSSIYDGNNTPYKNKK